MIRSKKELRFYIKADRMMNRGGFTRSIKDILWGIVFPDYIMDYLEAMRKSDYYNSLGGNKLLGAYYRMRQRKLGMKLGFSIPRDAFGYGLLIPHYGTIVVGGGNKIGNYAVLHTSTCINHGHKEIGNAFYLSTGAKVIGDIKIGDGVSVGANSLVNRSLPGNVMAAGSPAEVKRTSYPYWYKRDGEVFIERVKRIEELRITLEV